MTVSSVTFPGFTTAVSLPTKTKGIHTLTEDPSFDEIARCYYDAKEFPHVAAKYNTDFGRYAHHTPQAVFQPDTTCDLQKFIQLANTHQVPISLRGQGHSHSGLTLTETGVVITLSRLPKKQHFPNMEKGNALVVSANSTVKEVLEFVSKHKQTLPIVSDYLGLSIGGLLSTGGLGGGSYRAGPFALHVIGLEILTFDGQIQSCSRTQNPDLFFTALCSLGQMGIILSATLSLIDKKEHVHCQRLSYVDKEKFLADQLRLFEEKNMDHLKGFVKKVGGTTHYVIEAAVFYDEKSEEMEKAFQGLCAYEREIKDNSYDEFVSEVDGFIDFLTEQKKWDLPHPWYEVLIPKEHASAHLDNALENPFLTGSEPVLIYPINTEQLSLPLFIHPKKKISYLICLLYNCSPFAKPSNTEKILEKNALLYADAVKKGGCYYPPQALPSQAAWEAHLGEKLPLFQEAKQKYDPQGIRRLPY